MHFLISHRCAEDKPDVMPYRGTTVYIQRKITLIIWGVQSVELTEVVASLQLGESQAVLASEWEASQASLPSSELFFLEPPYVANACRYTHVPQAAAEAAMATAGRVAADPALCALAWHYYHCLRSVTYPRTTMPDWPSLDHILPGESGLFSLLVPSPAFLMLRLFMSNTQCRRQ